MSTVQINCQREYQFKIVKLTKLEIYKSLIRPVDSYGAETWWDIFGLISYKEQPKSQSGDQQQGNCPIYRTHKN